MLCVLSFLLLFGQARAIIISIHTLLIPPHLSIRTHCTRYLTAYVHVHNFSTLPRTATATTTLPTRLVPYPPLKLAFFFFSLSHFCLFPIYYTIKQKLCNPFFHFFHNMFLLQLQLLQRSLYQTGGIPPFLYIFFLHFHRLIYTLLPNHTISRSLFLSPFQKYYVPFFVFALFFFPF